MLTNTLERREAVEKKGVVRMYYTLAEMADAARNVLPVDDLRFLRDEDIVAIARLCLFNETVYSHIADARLKGNSNYFRRCDYIFPGTRRKSISLESDQFLIHLSCYSQAYGIWHAYLYYKVNSKAKRVILDDCFYHDTGSDPDKIVYVFSQGSCDKLYAYPKYPKNK